MYHKSWTVVEPETSLEALKTALLIDYYEVILPSILMYVGDCCYYIYILLGKTQGTDLVSYLLSSSYCFFNDRKPLSTNPAVMDIQTPLETMGKCGEVPHWVRNFHGCLIPFRGCLILGGRGLYRSFVYSKSVHHLRTSEGTPTGMICSTSLGMLPSPITVHRVLGMEGRYTSPSW